MIKKKLSKLGYICVVTCIIFYSLTVYFLSLRDILALVFFILGFISQGLIFFGVSESNFVQKKLTDY